MASLDAVAGAVGIADTVARSIHHLIQIINAIKNAPIEIADLNDELMATEQVLLVLEKANEHLPPTSRDMLQRTNTLCQNACDKFRVKLVSWTKNSDDGAALHWRDRVGYGVIGRSSVKSLREQLERSKQNVNLAVGIATL
ncbi:uncharacterized protein N7529_006998 [Penicillium soppii]|jgi:hypothetical protein|uniref:uncharacterized protein n=1 Tax=Penicillium soppii TaxID=69789 RepID=UPI002546BA1A|nr:uncharacterized protein N7529_006998 [Penicillium soppii]KAJ5865082.1 hypothetical protein N7529_006998 [Penicillium soppii]